MDEQQELESRITAELDGISPRRQAFNRWLLRILLAASEAVLRHWLLLVNLVNGLIMAGTVAVPLMMAVGMADAGSQLFYAYRLLCQQNPDRSYFLLGHQLAMDQRMVAMYGSSLLAGLLFALLRDLLRPLSWRTYFVLILPMAVDGFTQLFGWRTSNWELRTATGALFGVATVWLTYPYLERVARSGLGFDRSTVA